MLTVLHQEAGGDLNPVPRSKLFRKSPLESEVFGVTLDQCANHGYLKITEERQRPPKIVNNQSVPQPPRVEKQSITLTRSGQDEVLRATKKGASVRPLPPERPRAKPTTKNIIRESPGAMQATGKGQAGRGNQRGAGNAQGEGNRVAQNISLSINKAVAATRQAINEEPDALKAPNTPQRVLFLIKEIEQDQNDSSQPLEERLDRIDRNFGFVHAILTGVASSALYETAKDAVNGYFQARG